MGKKGPKAKPMSALFKMSPKTAAFVEAMEKGTPKQKAMAKAVRAKNESKDDVTGDTLMKADYAAMMGGYKSSPLPKKGPGDKEVDEFGTPIPDYGKKSDAKGVTGTMVTKTLGGPGGGAPIESPSGQVRKKGAKLRGGGKVLETTGTTKEGKKTSQTKQKIRTVVFNDTKKKNKAKQ